MRYLRCQCGKCEGWNSGMPENPCDGCKECNTTMSSSPSGHKELTPHEMVAYPIESDQGDSTLSRCRWCHDTKKTIEKNGEKWIDYKEPA